MKVIVVGSGPAGVSAAKGLLERGFQVTLLDAGNTLENEKKILLNDIQQGNLSPQINSIRHHTNAKSDFKLPYGSAFIYKDVGDHFSWQIKQCYFKPSFAQGGLSNVWGGAITEYSPSDLSDWPTACRDLSSYYSCIINWLNPYYTEDTSSRLSKQGVYLNDIWLKNQDQLIDRGFSFQSARLAVDMNRCKLCGSCQYGCPYKYIYHSSFHLEQLLKHPSFIYIDKVVVETFSEINHQVEVSVKHLHDKSSTKVFCDYLFVACGAGLSSLLYLRAMNETGRELTLKDSQHFLLPCLLRERIKGALNEPLHTLCQLKLSLSNNNVSLYPVHLQIYTYMDHYLREIKNKFKWIFPFMNPALNYLLERLLVVQGYLDSRESNQLTIKYIETGKFIIKEKKMNNVDVIINRSIKYINENHKQLAIKPLSLMMHRSMTGQSNHIGSSLPMSDHPKNDEVDIWGRPRYCERIHFVDGSILPSIPAGSITLTIMANAYRIGKEAPL